MTAEELAKLKRGDAGNPASARTLDPRTILFAAVPKRVNRFDDSDDGCVGCLFEEARSSICRMAGEEAKLRGIEDCECGYVYQAVKVDPRQIDLFKEDA